MDATWYEYMNKYINTWVDIAIVWINTTINVLYFKIEP